MECIGECIGVASGCGEQETGVASGSGWNLCEAMSGCINLYRTILVSHKIQNT